MTENKDCILEILIEDLTEEESKKMEEAIREICKRHGVEITSLETISVKSD